MTRKQLIHIAVVESDPFRLMGFRALFESESGFDLVPTSLSEIGGLQSNDLVLLSTRRVQHLLDLMASLKATRPDLRIIVTGSGDEETILNAIVVGAKGYVDEAASPAELLQAVRVVSQGSVWAPRHVFSMFIERVGSAPGCSFPTGPADFTNREKEVLQLLVAGHSNKEIASPPRHQGGYSESPYGQGDAESRRADETIVTHDSLPAIRTDDTQLAQVFQNLVGNAIKYRSAEVPHVHVSATRNDDDEWIFSVRDSGLGIDPQYFERISA